MTDKLEDYKTCCRFCMQTKFRTILLTPFHIKTFADLTGSSFNDHHSLPIIICIMCSRELRRFHDYRVKLIENQKKFEAMLAEEERQIVEIDSMAESIPKCVEDIDSMSDSTDSQDEIEFLDEKFELKLQERKRKEKISNVLIKMIKMKEVEKTKNYMNSKFKGYV